MKRIAKIFLVVISMLAILAIGASAYAVVDRLFFTQEQPEDPETSKMLGNRGVMRGPAGEVTSIHKDSLILLTFDKKELVVNCSPEIMVHLVESQSEGSLRDIQVGDKVAVHGQLNKDGTFQAQVIMLLPEDTELRGPPPLAGQEGKYPLGDPSGKGGEGGLGGEVTVISRESLTLITPGGQELLVRVNGQTVIHIVESGAKGALRDIQIGNRVQVHGHAEEKGVIQAREIVVLPEGEQFAGRVTAVAGKAITIESLEGRVTILVDKDTQFRVGKKADNGSPIQGSLEDVSKGKFVIAFGELRADGSLLAKLVVVHDGPPPSFVPGGGAPGF
jgi:hypothetical protein